MKLYIAGSSGDIARIRKWMGAVQEFTATEMATAAAPGINLTHNWLKVIEDRGAANPVNVTFHERASWAGDDLKGVREADAVWVLMPPGMSDGAMWEAGYADALGKDLIVSGPGLERTIFTARARCFDFDESAFDYLVDLYFNDLDSAPTNPEWAGV